jgi:hypothetical protein
LEPAEVTQAWKLIGQELSDFLFRLLDQIHTIEVALAALECQMLDTRAAGLEPLDCPPLAVMVGRMRRLNPLFVGRSSLLLFAKFPDRVHGNLLAKWLTLRGFRRHGAPKSAQK